MNYFRIYSFITERNLKTENNEVCKIILDCLGKYIIVKESYSKKYFLYEAQLEF